MESISTGSYIGLAGIIVSILAHYNIVIGQDSAVAVIAGIVALYGVLHQLWAHKKGIALGTIQA